jgi:hypothetical protein
MDVYNKCLQIMCRLISRGRCWQQYGNIILQQGCAKAHLSEDNAFLKAQVTEPFGDRNAAKQNTQSVHRPNLIVNDLSLFNTLQSGYYRPSPKNSIELIEMVEDTCNNYPLEKLNRVWLTLQNVINKIIE